MRYLTARRIPWTTPDSYYWGCRLVFRPLNTSMLSLKRQVGTAEEPAWRSGKRPSWDYVRFGMAWPWALQSLNVTNLDHQKWLEIMSVADVDEKKKGQQDKPAANHALAMRTWSVVWNTALTICEIPWAFFCSWNDYACSSRSSSQALAGGNRCRGS